MADNANAIAVEPENADDDERIRFVERGYDRCSTLS
jgi:hypothetical protein